MSITITVSCSPILWNCDQLCFTSNKTESLMFSPQTQSHRADFLLRKRNQYKTLNFNCQTQWWTNKIFQKQPASVARLPAHSGTHSLINHDPSSLVLATLNLEPANINNPIEDRSVMIKWWKNERSICTLLPWSCTTRLWQPGSAGLNFDTSWSQRRGPSEVTQDCSLRPLQSLQDC